MDNINSYIKTFNSITFWISVFAIIFYTIITFVYFKTINHTEVFQNTCLAFFTAALSYWNISRIEAEEKNQDK